MEKASSLFRCILKTAGFLCTRLYTFFFGNLPPEDSLTYCPFISLIALAWQTVFYFLIYRMKYEFPGSITRFSENSFLSDIVLDGPTLSQEEVYFFNITNAEDFLERGAALNVTEVGPYIYRVWTDRFNLVWDGESQTVSFSEESDYDFFSAVSPGSQDDEIITWNGPFIIVAESLMKSNRSFRQEFLSGLNLTAESVFVKKKVKELAFGHYHDDLLKKASLANLSVPRTDGKFSWLKYKKNHRNFTVSTGDSDTGIVKKYNGMDNLGIWNGDACNKVKGAFGKIGPPIPPKDFQYSVFLPDLCRSLTIPRWEKDVDGYQNWIYAVSEKTFANSTENPDNYCFETSGSRPSGVYSVSSCNSGAPLWLSFPHFYLGDPSYAKNINGLNADETVHRSFFKVNQNFGWGKGMKLSIQMNIEIGEICDISPFNHIPKGIYPVLWSTTRVIEKGLSWVPFFISRAQTAAISPPIKYLAVILPTLVILAVGKYFSMCLGKVSKMIVKEFRDLKIRKAENNEGDQVDSSLDVREPLNETVLLEIKN